jgi:hypothetical protein
MNIHNYCLTCVHYEEILSCYNLPIPPPQKRKLKVIGKKKVIKKGNIWKKVFDNVVTDIHNYRYAVRMAKIKQVKLKYKHDLKQIMHDKGIKTTKDIKNYYQEIGIYYVYKSCKTKQNWIDAYSKVYSEKWYNNLCNTPDMLYYKSKADPFYWGNVKN